MELVGTFFGGIGLVGRACGDDEGSAYQSNGGEEEMRVNAVPETLQSCWEIIEFNV